MAACAKSYRRAGSGLSQDQRSIKNETPKKALGDRQWNLASVASFRRRRPGPYQRNDAISRHFERDPIPYALETDWPVGAVGLEPLHCEVSDRIVVRVLIAPSMRRGGPACWRGLFSPAT
jgi:hypothetical protein